MARTVALDLRVLTHAIHLPQHGLQPLTRPLQLLAHAAEPAVDLILGHPLVALADRGHDAVHVLHRLLHALHAHQLTLLGLLLLLLLLLLFLLLLLLLLLLTLLLLPLLLLTVLCRRGGRQARRAHHGQEDSGFHLSPRVIGRPLLSIWGHARVASSDGRSMAKIRGSGA
jgi:hypothetical protein